MLALPVRLHQDAVDLLDVDVADAVADGLHHGGDTEVARAAEELLVLHRPDDVLPVFVWGISP